MTKHDETAFGSNHSTQNEGAQLWRSWPRITVGAMAASCMLLLTTLPSKAQVASESYADLIARVMPSVVNISVDTVVPTAGPRPSKSTPEQPQQHTETMLGSGFIIDPSGYVVTNRHVVINSYAIIVSLSDGTRLPAHVVGHPPATDIALLKVKADHPLPAIKWGDSDNIHVGDRVLAIGNPLGFGGTVTAGIVSALNRNGFNTPYDNYIQTDAAINHGNSGGPLFNMNGQVIGVNTILITTGAEGSIGLGLAIPSDDARFAATELREFGRVKPGWIGAALQPVTPDLADAFGLNGTGGALVASVAGSGPAAEAGLAPGDIIETFNGDTPRDVRALMRMIAEYPLDRTAALDVRRRGSDRAMTVMIKEFPPAEMVADFPFRLANPPAMAAGDAGFHLIPITAAARTRFGLAANVPGLEVAAVLPESAADRAQLHKGDVVLDVGSQPASMPADVQHALERAQQARRQYLALLIAGASGEKWIALPVKGPE